MEALERDLCTHVGHNIMHNALEKIRLNTPIGRERRSVSGAGANSSVQRRCLDLDPAASTSLRRRHAMEMQSDRIIMEPDDRLSALPDDILFHVVKDLDVDAVVRLSALSRRWRHIPLLLSDLTIDVTDFLPRDYVDEDEDEDDVQAQRHRTIMLAYADAARKLLAPSAARSIKSMRLRFFMAEPSSCRLLGDIIKEAATGFVDTERLEFDVLGATTTTTQQAAFGGRGAACSSRLLIQQHTRKKAVVSRQLFMSFFTACPVAFGCVTSLALHNLHLRARDVPRILGGCPRLQLLSLSHCSCRGRKAESDLVVLQIDAPRSRLAALELRFCSFVRVDVIRAPELRRVHCDTWYGDVGETCPPVRFCHVPRLRTLTLAWNVRRFWELNVPFDLADFMPKFHTDWNLSTLHLDLRDRMTCIGLPYPDPNLTQRSSTFSNLRDVYLYNISKESNLNWTLFFLEAAPSLKNLYIKIYRHVCKSADSAPCLFDPDYLPWMTWTPSSDFKHHNLQLLEIVGYAVECKLEGYIRLVMECAVCLKRVRLLEHEPCGECAYQPQPPQPHCPVFRETRRPKDRWVYPCTEYEKNSARARLTQGSSCSIVKIVIG